eukprot:g85.t1
MQLADVSGDGDAKLLVADADRKLKIFKGTSMLSEHLLLDVPVALCAFYTDASEPRIPAVAVAAGPHVFIYRNLRPYFKFKLPLVALDEREMALWAELKASTATAAQGFARLHALRDEGAQLSSRSCDLLALEDAPAAQREAFVAKVKHAPLAQQTVATCMATLRKNSEHPDAVSSLVVGTESRAVLVLNPPGSAVVAQCELRAVPVHLAVDGLLDVDYRIAVGCRDGCVYTIKNGKVTAVVIGLEAQPCALIALDRSLLVGCMNSTVSAFSVKGRKQFALRTPCPVTELCAVHVERAHSVKAFLVSLYDGAVRLYSWAPTAEGSRLLACFSNGSAVVGLRFGRFGREDNSLALVHRSGALTIKMLSRKAELSAPAEPPGPPPEQDVPLKIPKKTRLYVEQTQRERDQATEMHRVFQRDLCKLRVATARAYCKIIADGGAAGDGGGDGGSGGPGERARAPSLRLSARVLGIGPLFKIALEVQNTGSESLTDVPLACQYDHRLYQLPDGVHRLPLLIPGVLYRHEIEVAAVAARGKAGAIRVLVCNAASTVPFISAIVNMPIVDLLEE